MENPFDFFVAKQYSRPDPDPSVQPFIDQIASVDFFRAVRAIADKYKIDYVVARAGLIEVAHSQSTFNLYSICCSVFDDSSWAAREFKSRLVENRRIKLEELVAKITPENTHEEINWGKAVGQEIWWSDEDDAGN